MSGQTKHELVRPKRGYEDPSISTKMRLLYNTRYLLLSNHQEMLREMDALKNPGKSILIWQDHENLETYELQIVRRLHNYLASAKTLIDHTRLLADELYRDTDFWNEYQDKKNATFVSVPLAQFVQNLRNYTLHRALPFTSSTLDLGTGHTSISLSTTQLRLWDGWSVKAREYLDGIGDSVPLDEIINGYTTIVREFYVWLYDRQKKLHFEW